MNTTTLTTQLHALWFVTIVTILLAVIGLITMFSARQRKNSGRVRGDVELRWLKTVTYIGEALFAADLLLLVGFQLGSPASNFYLGQHSWTVQLINVLAYIGFALLVIFVIMAIRSGIMARQENNRERMGWVDLNRPS